MVPSNLLSCLVFSQKLTILQGILWSPTFVIMIRVWNDTEWQVLLPRSCRFFNIYWFNPKYIYKVHIWKWIRYFYLNYFGNMLHLAQTQTLSCLQNPNNPHYLIRKTWGKYTDTYQLKYLDSFGGKYVSKIRLCLYQLNLS